ncbi:MAG: hypothetical protein DRH23_15040 [Deltaproteobacteria bacterium]|nr:MAG: hypothetical protein DRH23_15040 [Deltaproteobacteria bacterium]
MPTGLGAFREAARGHRRTLFAGRAPARTIGAPEAVFQACVSVRTTEGAEQLGASTLEVWRNENHRVGGAVRSAAVGRGRDDRALP